MDSCSIYYAKENQKKGKKLVYVVMLTAKLFNAVY